MKIFVLAKPGSKTEGIEKLSENTFAVRVKEPAREGRANQAIIEVLADYFKISKYQVKILSGETSKKKIVNIINERS